MTTPTASYLFELERQERFSRVCDAMRRARVIARMSQNALAKEIGSSATLISRYERGATVPSLMMAFDMAKVLGITLDEFIGIRPLPEEWVEKMSEGADDE